MSMPFSKKIIEEALVASARHCCVCKQFKSIKVEVHHIIPEGKGGDNTFDNAIVLCLDCHADAGHYNADHPKGNKFSPEELKKHRDTWYENVKRNNISTNEGVDLVHCRYYITKEPSLIKEITEGNFSRFPVKKTLIHNNTILEFQKRIISNFKLDPIVFDVKDTDAEEKYLKEHPDVKKVDSRNSPFYSYTRVPRKEEIIKTCGNMKACRFLLSTGEDINNLFKSFAFFEPCGGTFQERLHIRPIWACYLCITNISDKYIEVNKINYKGVLEDNLWTTFMELENQVRDVISLPELKISPNESIAIPILTLLGPFDDNGIEEISSNEEIFYDVGELVITSHSKLTDLKDNSKFNILGPGIIPNKIDLKYNDLGVSQSLHQFNFSNMFIYNRDFMCGCCPHIFFNKNNNLEYHGEVFSKKPNELQVFRIIIPSHVDAFILSELEYEKTFILEIKINKKSIISNKFIKKGECIKFKVKAGDIIEGIGCYYLDYNIMEKPSPMHKNNIIKRYILENCDYGKVSIF